MTDASQAPRPRKQPGASWPLDYEGEFNLPVLVLPLLLASSVPAVWSGKAWDAPVLLIVLVAAMGLSGVVQLVLQRWDFRFRRWILANWVAISNGEAVYEGVTVGPETVLALYDVSYSCLAITSRSHSGPVVPGTPSARRARWMSLLVTALGGWWSLSGIILTPLTLIATIRDRPTWVRMADVANATLYAKPLGECEVD